MKKLLFIIMLLFLTSITFVSCTPDTFNNETEQADDIGDDEIKDDDI